jgi:hypothetical protein
MKVRAFGMGSRVATRRDKLTLIDRLTILPVSLGEMAIGNVRGRIVAEVFHHEVPAATA